MIGEVQDVKSNVLLGTIGAILGAILGATVWVLIYQLGYVASIAGLAIIMGSYKGYTLFSRRKEKKAAVIAIIASILVLICAHFLCWGIDFAKELNVTIIEGIATVPLLVFNSEVIQMDGTILLSFFRDLLIGFVLIGVGYFHYIRKDLRGTPNPFPPR